MKIRGTRNLTKKITNFRIALKCSNIPVNALVNLCFVIGNTEVIPVPYNK